MATRPLSRLRLHLLRLRLHRRLRARLRLRLLASSLLLTACAGGAPADEAPAEPSHVFSSEAAGVALRLPPSWSGRYRATDSIATPTAGLQREIALRFVMADSTVAAEPMLVLRLFANAGWDALPADAAGARWGTIVARDAAHTLAAKPAAANPLTPGTADALGYDSLMMAMLQRQLTASLRPPTSR